MDYFTTPEKKDLEIRKDINQNFSDSAQIKNINLNKMNQQKNDVIFYETTLNSYNKDNKIINEEEVP